MRKENRHQRASKTRLPYMEAPPGSDWPPRCFVSAAQQPMTLWLTDPDFQIARADQWVSGKLPFIKLRGLLAGLNCLTGRPQGRTGFRNVGREEPLCLRPPILLEDINV